MELSKITESLYITSRLRSDHIEAIREMDIKLVINMIVHIRPPRALSDPPGDIQVLWLRTFDFFLLPIPLRTLKRGVEAALPVIERGQRVLVYCEAGRHRSVAMASCILIGLGHSPEEAMDLIAGMRKVADPRAWHIQRQIRRFESYWQEGQERQGP